ncbi:peptidylprolyl isomerase [SAR86 cluster bacterium]|jgi:hypothetical protein|nr:peptidylprolyl isomerase [SAR86 cluster bacterium]
MNKKLFLFLGIGISIFLIDLLFNPTDEDKTIYITNDEVISLINAWSIQVGRDPNVDEIRSIIDGLVEEEILYREALRLGLDNEDRIIKRRLAQKITFLRQESISIDPSDKELIPFYDTKTDFYTNPAKFSFTHLYFSIEENAIGRANLALAKINDEEIFSGADPFLLGKNFSNRSIESIEKDFGVNFTKIFDSPILDTWVGPVKSSYGIHLVKISDQSASYLPEFEEIRPQVKIDYLLEQRDSQIKSYLEELKAKYKVVLNPSFAN